MYHILFGNIFLFLNFAIVASLLYMISYDFSIDSSVLVTVV